jgi:hypothetical protein
MIRTPRMPESANVEWREGRRATVKVVQRAAAKSWGRIVPMYGQGLAEARFRLEKLDEERSCDRVTMCPEDVGVDDFDPDQLPELANRTR